MGTERNDNGLPKAEIQAFYLENEVVTGWPPLDEPEIFSKEDLQQRFKKETEHGTSFLLETSEVIDLIINNPDVLHKMFPKVHPEHETIDIAHECSKTNCIGCLDQVADLIRLSMEKL